MIRSMSFFEKLSFWICFIGIIFKANGSMSDENFLMNIVDKGSRVDIAGNVNLSWSGQQFYSFRGIPFAKAPISELRFKDPQPLETLPPFIDAKYDGHDCPSIYATNASEDCLTLNVYTTDFNPPQPLPVLVFISPGGFYIGSGLSSFLGPEYLMDKPLVVVTFNYRLGSLGFLNLGTKEVPGNAGLKDQVLALRWVKEYIHHFGGNPENVTIMGYSAGGLSVGLHLVSPMSQGLFSQAIIMSGNMPPQTSLPKGDDKDLAKRQVERLNCSFEESNVDDSILKCLSEKEGSEIAATLRQMFDFGKDNPIYLWLPIIENDFGQERFLTKDFFESLKQGEYAKVPILSGFTDGEFCTSAAEILQDNTLASRFFEKFDELAPIIFMYKNHSKSDEITKAIRDKYIGGKMTQQNSLNRLCDLFSDALIRFGGDRIASLVSKDTSVLSYKFVYKGNFSNFNFPGANPPRVEHVDDLMYLFKMPGHIYTKDDPDAHMVNTYVNFIYDFIAKGTLSSEAKYPSNFALIDRSITSKEGRSFDEADFWNNLIP